MMKRLAALLLLLVSACAFAQTGPMFNYPPRNPIFSGPLTVESGTLTDSAPALSITQTWNDGTEAFIGATMNITDTASSNGSLLQRWQIGGNDIATVGKGGTTNGVLGAVRATTTNASAVGITSVATFPATATTTAEGFRAAVTVSDTGGSGTFAQVVNFRSNNATKSGGADTITKQVGFQANAMTVGAANYGFEGLLAVSGTARYNLYMSGTAPNHLAGQLFAGHTASVTLGQANKVQVAGDGTTAGGLSLSRYSADAIGPVLEFSKSRHATIGSNTIAQSADALGSINFYGGDGTDYDLAAQITAEVDGTPGAGTDMPGRVRVLVSPDGSATPAEVARFDSVKVTLSKPLLNGGTAPTMGACGTNPSVVGTDNGVVVTVGTGGSATSCAVSFSRTYTNAPACVAKSNTDQTSLIVATTTTTVTVTKATAFTASSKLHIICSHF